MSTHYGWEPAEPQPLGGTMSPHMRDVLSESYANGSATDLIGVTLDETDLPWLSGVLQTARTLKSEQLIHDAEELTSAIRRHKRIVIVHSG